MEQSHFDIEASKVAEACDSSGSDEATALIYGIREAILRATGRCRTD
jgi:hypothetical protein